MLFFFFCTFLYKSLEVNYWQYLATSVQKHPQHAASKWLSSWQFPALGHLLRDLMQLAPVTPTCIQFNTETGLVCFIDTPCGFNARRSLLFWGSGPFAFINLWQESCSLLRKYCLWVSVLRILKSQFFLKMVYRRKLDLRKYFVML